MIYASVEVFNFNIYNKDGKRIFIDTVKQNDLYRNGNNLSLTVTDALLRVDDLNDIMGGSYSGYLRIVGDTIFRDANTGKDHDIELNITVAELVSTNISFSSGDFAQVVMTFDMPVLDAYGFKNVQLKNIGESVDKH